jgi:hypothetical protein
MSHQLRIAFRPTSWRDNRGCSSAMPPDVPTSSSKRKG